MHRRILLVEHDRRVALAVEATVVGIGAEVVGRATHVDDALRKIDRLQPEVVLVDIGIPGGGLQVLTALRATDQATVILLAPDETALEKAAAHGPALLVNADAPRLAVTIELACRAREERTQACQSFHPAIERA